MNPLIYLLMGQQAGAPAAVPQGSIDVVGNRARPESMNEGLSINNSRAVMDREADIKETEAASDRRGMFGMKGTLRDVVGILGDAFLIQSGNSPIYMPTRQRERISDAQAGFSQGGQETLDAAERVGYYDPAYGRDLLSDYDNKQLKEAQLRSLEADRSSKIADRRAGMIADGRVIAQRVLGQPGAYGPDGELTPAALKVLGRVAGQYETTIDELIGADITGEEARLLGTADMNVNQQRNLPLAERRTAATESQARSSAIRASRPPAGRAPRAESDREAFLRIGEKPAKDRTQAEQDFYNKYKGSGSGGVLSQFGVTPPATRRLGPPRN